MKRTIYIAVVGLILSFVFNYAYAQERITLSTYYPAPYGEYRKLAIGSSAGGYTAPTSDDIDLVVEGGVGIGTTTPTGTLHVVGGTAAPGKDGTNITLEAQNGGWGNRDGGNIILLPGTDGGPVGGADGNVGIGTTSPQAKLDVVGDGDAIIVPRKSTAGDPSGVNGMIYYNTSTGRFRVFENGEWKDLVGGGGGAFGSWTNQDSDSNALVKGAVYEVTSDGYVCAYITAFSVYIYGYTDDIDATTVRFKAESAHADTGNPKGSFTMPVRKGDFWRITSNGNPDSIYWLPIGSGECERQ